MTTRSLLVFGAGLPSPAREENAAKANMKHPSAALASLLYFVFFISIVGQRSYVGGLNGATRLPQ
jgi:hypothetical protein